MDEAARADRVIVINDGKLVMDGSAKEIFSRVDYLHSIGLEAPQGKELINDLIKLGYRIPSDVLSEDECTDALLTMIKSFRKE
jgi:energy-coupling factor transport system ATP-binding protein